MKFEQDVGVQIDDLDRDDLMKRIEDLQSLMTKENLIETLKELDQLDKEVTDDQIKDQLEQTRAFLLISQHWSQLAESLIANQDESSIRQVLDLIPTNAPHSKKLKQALVKVTFNVH